MSVVTGHHIVRFYECQATVPYVGVWSFGIQNGYCHCLPRRRRCLRHVVVNVTARQPCSRQAAVVGHYVDVTRHIIILLPSNI